MAGEDKAIELVLEKIWALKQVGVSMYYNGHTKKKSLTDVVTGLEYEMLTTNMSNRYFNAIKTKLHILGVASIDRRIETKRVKQKVGADKQVGKVLDESRIITFRDDNFNIDSKSRFADIIPQIILDRDEFVKAIEDAIKAAHDKQKGNKKSIEETKVDQEAEKETEIEKAIEKEVMTGVNVGENLELTEVIKGRFTDAPNEVKVKVKEIMTEFKITSFKDTSEVPTEALRRIVELLG